MRRKDRVCLSLSITLLELIEERRGLVSRSAYVEYLIRLGLAALDGRGTPGQAP